jgi:hypothetical protein
MKERNKTIILISNFLNSLGFKMDKNVSDSVFIAHNRVLNINWAK